MAKTFWAEGRQMAKGVSALLLMIAFSFYFLIIPGLHWGFLFGSIFISILFGEMFGAHWTKKRRMESKNGKRKKIKVEKPHGNNTQIAKKNLSDKDLLFADIDSLSGTDFERIIEMYYRDKGFPVQRIGGSGDHGVDIIVQERDGARVAIQCKRQKQDVGNAVVLKLDSGKRAHKCHVGRIVTTAYFTRDAQDAAERLRIDLVNRMSTINMIDSWRKKKITKNDF